MERIIEDVVAFKAQRFGGFFPRPWSLSDWRSFFREWWVPTPKEKLKVSPALRPAFDALDWQDMHGACFVLLQWIRDEGKRDPLGAGAASDLAHFLDLVPELGALFEVSEGQVRFRNEVPGAHRTEITAYVRANVPPPIVTWSPHPPSR